MKPVSVIGFIIFDIDRRIDLACFDSEIGRLKLWVILVQFKRSILLGRIFLELFCSCVHLITDTLYLCCKMTKLIIGK